MDELKKIAYNCKKATFLIEKKQVGRISAREKLELEIHLAGCSVCRTFQKQSTIINRMVKALFSSSKQRDVRLDEHFKLKLQQTINSQLQDN